MYFINFTLKQHTPLIHFEHAEEGATLRATEVKPKLDRFIAEYAEKILGNSHSNAINAIKSTIQSKSASLYKMHFTSKLDKKELLFSFPTGNDEGVILSNQNAKKLAGNNLTVNCQTPLFSNNSKIKIRTNEQTKQRYIQENQTKWNELSVGVWLKDIKIKIICFDNDIFKLIDAILPYFFCFENFGLRQSKGFGSFTIEEKQIDFDTIFKTFSSLPNIAIYRYNINTNEPLKVIRDFWRKIKSGNSRNPYQKSELMKYFCMLDKTRWEKRAIKKELYDKHTTTYNILRKDNYQAHNRIIGCNGDSNDPDKVYHDEKYKYIRALLGMAELYEFGVYNASPIKITISGGDDLQRFKSPVTFKVIDNKIWMICLPIPDSLSNREHNKVNFKFNDELLTSLPIPANFSLSDFFDSPWLDNTLNQPQNRGDYTTTKKTTNKTVAEHYHFTKINQQL